MKMSDYYDEIERGKRALVTLLTDHETWVAKVADPDLDRTDWDSAIWSIQNALNAMAVSGAIHQFERVSKEQMVAMFRAYDQGQPTGKVVTSTIHDLTSYDTPRSLSVQYGVPWETILEHNKLTVSELKSAKTIEIPTTGAIRAGNKEIMVFGDQTGMNVLGRDVSRDLVAENGDLKAMIPGDTFRQAMENLEATTPGEAPYYESYGLDALVGEDYGSEAIAAMAEVRVYDAFRQDPRVQTVSIRSSTVTDGALTVEVEIQPIHGEMLQLTSQVSA